MGYKITYNRIFVRIVLRLNIKKLIEVEKSNIYSVFKGPIYKDNNY